MDAEKPFRERRGARWLARAGAVVGCAVALGGGYAAAAGGLGSVTVFTDGLTTDAGQYEPGSIAPGSDGALWFGAIITNANSMIGRIAPDGTITKFVLNGQDSLGELREGPDGNLWFGDSYPTPLIGRITPDGSVTEFPTGSSPGSSSGAIAPASDGDIWFTEVNQIGKLTPNGAIIRFGAGLAKTSDLYDIAAGPDGDMWFTDRGFPAVGKITPAGAITEYTDGLSPSNNPAAIAQGPDGNMWFADHGIARITPGGQITQFSLPVGGGNAQQIAPGPDGNMWFTIGGTGAVGEITPDGAVTEFVTQPGFFGRSLATGPDGALWLTGITSQTGQNLPAIARIDIGAPPASVTPPTVSGSGQEGDVQSCAGATWSAWAGQQPSLTASGADGYRWLLDGSVLPGETSASYIPTSGDVGHQLSCTVTGTYSLSSATVAASSAPVTVVPRGTTTTTTTTTSRGGSGGGAATTTTSTTSSTPSTAPTQTAPVGTLTTTTTTPARQTSSSRTAAKVSIVSIATVHLEARSPKLHVSLKASKACEAVLVLLAPNGKQLARWTRHLKAGRNGLALLLPAKARHTGRDRLRVQTAAAKATTATIALRP